MAGIGNLTVNVDQRSGEVFFHYSVMGDVTGEVWVMESGTKLLTLSHGQNGYFGKYTTNGAITYPLQAVSGASYQHLQTVIGADGNAVTGQRMDNTRIAVRKLSVGNGSVLWQGQAIRWYYDTSYPPSDVGIFSEAQVAVDGQNGIYYLVRLNPGNYSGSLAIDRATDRQVITLNGESGYVLAKYSSAGVVEWFRFIPKNNLKDLKIIAGATSVLLAAYADQATTLALDQALPVSAGQVAFAEMSGEGVVYRSTVHSLGSVTVGNISVMNQDASHYYFGLRLNNATYLPILKLSKEDGTISQSQIPNTNGSLYDLRSLFPKDGGKFEVVGRAQGTGTLTFGGLTVERLGSYQTHTFLSTVQDSRCAGTASLAVCLRWDSPLEEVVVAAGMEDYVYNGQPKPCAELQMELVRNSVESQTAEAIARLLGLYQERYGQQCASPDKLVDELTLRYSTGLHHYTLYYYDRAGRLQRTVPPEGVQLLAVDQASLATSRTQLPAHRLVTRYRYNSVGQLVEQVTPDAGLTRFYYNSMGQLRFSQNARQAATGAYSYTRYDGLGRVVEVGQSTQAGFAGKADEGAFPQSGRTHVTGTVYSEARAGLLYQGRGQERLQHRVSYTYYDVDGDPATLGDRNWTSYSYDSHGHVAWLSQELAGLGRKYVGYEYELVSGKVLRVNYQAGEADQFYHRYEYDGENRVTGVWTSTDGQLWEREAGYSYYAHGPLQRLELGQDLVQGVDYSYTVQGWLKGLNEPTLTPAYDPGGDGTAGRAVGRDAFGMALGYYSGDYKRAGHVLEAGTGAGQQQELLSSLYGEESRRGLYNGNIATWSARQLDGSATVPEQGNELYVYDELNRLKRSTYYTYNAGLSGNKWVKQVKFATTYGYDANGNLALLTRNDGGGNALDRLTYHYSRNGSGQLLANRLLHVSEGAGATTTLRDVENQNAGNYAYDAIGNLTQDVQAGISSIAWNPYGKVQQVTKGSGNVLFDYDASGNRVRKQTGTGAATYYVRDASGVSAR